MEMMRRARSLPVCTIVLALIVTLAASCGDATDGEAGGTAADPAADDLAAEETEGDGEAGTGGDLGDPAVEGDSGSEAPSDAAAGPDDGGSDAESSTAELFPDVLGATAERGSDGSWTFSATLSSPYDTPQRYADAWRVVGPDGEVYGIRELAHDHAGEQPFSRSQSGIIIPEDVTTVTVEGRDQLSGWGGATVEVQLAG